MNNIILNLLYKNKALDIKIFRPLIYSDLIDYVIITTSRSIKHAESIKNNVLLGIKGYKLTNNFTTSGEKTDWIVIDIDNIIIHIMSKNIREYYNIEELITNK